MIRDSEYLERIIPVIDIRGGVAVGAKGGNRNEYMPLESVISDSPDPVEIAKSYEKNGFREIYIADLDGIIDDNPNIDILKEITYKTTIRAMVDIGIWDAERLRTLSRIKPIIATETFTSLNLLEIPGEFVLSLDTRDGKLICEMNMDLDRFIDIVIRDSGRINEIILLDLARVGMSEGPNIELCRHVLERIPNKNIIYGGGIRNLKDIGSLFQAGISRVLVGRLIHEGGIFKPSC